MTMCRLCTECVNALSECAAKMHRRCGVTGIVAIVLVSLSAPSRTAARPYTGGNGAGSQSTTITGRAYRFEMIADGVYYATATGAMVTGSNVPVIVNAEDVLIVDTGTTPAATRALLLDLKVVTAKPVRYVVNTHFHYDHTNGNQVFGSDVQIIAHEYVRTAIQTFDVLNREPFRTSQLVNVPNRITSLSKQIADEPDSALRGGLERQRAVIQAGWEQLKEVKPTPPTTTYASRMTIRRGARDIQLLFLGRGHTEGDTFVFLPKERIVCTGDMMESVPAYMGDGLFDEWVATLENLKKLDFDVVLPGHGTPFRGKEKISGYQAYLTDLMGQVEELRHRGLSPEEAVRRIDLTAHASTFPSIQGLGISDIRGVRRMYEWIAERERR